VKVSGTFFPGHTSRAVPAHASLSDNAMLTITDVNGAILVVIPFRKVRVTTRLGKVYRCLEFPAGGHFETSDNDGIDAMLRAAGLMRRGALIDRLESSLRWVAVSVLIAGISIALMIEFGFPMAAAWLAQATPRPALTAMSTQTLKTMDELSLSPSHLSDKDKQKANALFARVAAVGAGGRSGYHLIFRSSRSAGPNAFSLPDGTIILTDQLYELVKRDDELEGVFGHEIAHVDHRHVLQTVYEDSLIPVAIALMTGDASQFGQIAAVLPLMLIQSSYSRDFEQQADDESARMMERIGADPSALGDLLERMDKKLCGKEGCAPGWLGSHPATEERAVRLREEAKAAHAPHP
jgi:Zn-dependent protease with chaperone function